MERTPGGCELMPTEAEFRGRVGDELFFVDLRRNGLVHVARRRGAERQDLILSPEAVPTLISLLEAARAAHIAIAMRPPDDPAPQAAPRYERIRQRHPKAYAPWLPEDDEQLAEMTAEGLSPAEIGSRLGRHPSAIRSRLRKKA